jgi:acetolactate synthase-1/2/3 large subunit
MDPGPLGTLGVGPGYAMAAKLARPEARVIIVYGDGSFALNGFEFEAMARQGIQVTGVIGNDAAWSQIRRGQLAMFGNDRAVATRLDCTRYEQVVIPLGCHGEYVEHSDQLAPALDRAFASEKPAVVNIMLAPSDFRRDSISV